MEDKNIVDLYWQRSERAIEETERKYGGYCRSIARNILSDSRDSEECVSDTWLSAWNSMPKNRPSALTAYLGKICRNHALSRLQYNKCLKRGGGEAEAAFEELDNCLTSANPDAEKQIEMKELQEAIKGFLYTLDECERKVFLSRYFFFAPVKEIAEKFGFTLSKTASMLRRTRLKLITYLEQEGLC